MITIETKEVTAVQRKVVCTCGGTVRLTGYQTDGDGIRLIDHYTCAVCGCRGSVSTFEELEIKK